MRSRKTINGKGNHRDSVEKALRQQCRAEQILQKLYLHSRNWASAVDLPGADD